MNAFLKYTLPLFIVLAAAAAEPVRLDSAGRLLADELRFAVDCWDGKRNYTQGAAKNWVIAKPKEDAGAWRAEGTFALPGETASPLTLQLRKTGEGSWLYEFELKPAARSFTFRTAMPAALFAGRKLLLDGKEIELPEEKEKQVVFTGKGKRLEIPGSDGLLTLTGELSILIHDYRPRPENFSLLIQVPAAADARRLRLEIAHAPWAATPIDLTKAVNMGFADDVAGDGKGGWTDQGRENDLRMIPPGPQRWQGTLFQIIDPAKNGGKACLVLQGAERPRMPESAAAAIAGENVRGRHLFLLHALAWGSRNPALGTVTLAYRDGTRQEIPVRAGRDAGNWWAPATRENGEVVWTGENRSSYVGLYRSTWPIEDKPIAAIEFRSAGNAVWMIAAASVGDRLPPRAKPQPSYIVAGKDWQPIDFAKDVEPGSILDFSRRLDAPAGKYGPVIIRNGRFVFRDRPERPLRFYGTNLCSLAPYVDKEWAERLAARMAQYGFNAVRLHHHDGGIGRKDRTTELNLPQVDRLDYLVYCLKKQGIYLTTDLYVSRRLPKGEIPEYPEALTDISVYKALFWVLDSVYANWETHVRNYLTHVNPYTGLIIKDDPVLISINLINEGNIKSCWNANPFTRRLYEERFALWQREKNLAETDTPAERNRRFEEFLTETYEKRYAEMVAFVRSLGVSCPLSDQNMGSSPKLATMRRLYDYVDNHGYSSHPRFAATSWQLPSLLAQKSAINRSPLPWNLAASRLFGKPFTVTEFDYAKPNRFRAEGPALIGAYAGLQGWDALYQFAYSHGFENYQKDDRAGGHFDIATDVVKSLSQRIGVALFSDSGVPEAAESFAVLLTDGKDLPFELNYPAELGWIGLTTRIGTLLTDGKQPLPPNCRALFDLGVKFPQGNAYTPPVFKVTGNEENLANRLTAAKILTPGQCDADREIYRSFDGKLELDRKGETFKAVSPGCEVLILPAGKEGRGDLLAVKNLRGRAVFAAIAADGKPLKTSARLLLLHLTDTQATKARFASAALEQLDQWGTTPFLAERGEAVLTLRPAAGKTPRLHAVDTAGKRLAEVPVTAAGDGVFTAPLSVFNRFGTVLAYEVSVD